MTSDNEAAHFCWFDLAASESKKAAPFYEGMFGWKTRTRRGNGGEFVQFVNEGKNFASLYQLNHRHIAQGVPSHWTPYVAVSNIDEMASKATTLGGQVVVHPFSVDGVAEISLITDAVGALFGIMEAKHENA